MQRSDSIDHFVRGLNPYPGAWSYLSKKARKIKVKIYKVVIIDQTQENSVWFITKDAGTKISEQLTSWVLVKVIQKNCMYNFTNQVVEIIEIQLPGKRKMLPKIY